MEEPEAKQLLQVLLFCVECRRIFQCVKNAMFRMVLILVSEKLHSR